ncbi:hypothetical protein TGRUB_227390 [Toxoplasma gondii RUB]|uniref:SET domain-containing protein n=9 Tax=Toxoplasma gondii TaxID=5811 RepID=S7UX38_TOXGG|nr:hypothetical protein TGGT1_227390 [Toxoplasma gondii GT1]KAF4640764.1 hypothetical protein TGRH88_046900 [Toxoplasma gondii]KFG45150.1 hypothetical protein TGDOM2_227390 [Toxoplasma gondii GAB2-2007-GAL-DOM2]KFG51980.1 hypothetical protein TGFOU_227390 [Toxoplasma gondii FOU]KFG61010.1 hypothetical protein TGRUB_227390 [Toxoplasma gondii RUB]KFH10368.1 hypothetical protein TGMAS_227390 [Toxoplasma gondii MAS]KFH12958.1 hypothetical protein TGVAND_227390 [Toxoplasma gondii VAND]PUA91028.1 
MTSVLRPGLPRHLTPSNTKMSPLSSSSLSSSSSSSSSASSPSSSPPSLCCSLCSPCLACPSPGALGLALPLTAQTACPSRLAFRQRLLERLGLPTSVAYLPSRDVSPFAIRRLCAQLVDAFRICYMSDQDLYFADAVARELEREARGRRAQRRRGGKVDALAVTPEDQGVSGKKKEAEEAPKNFCAVASGEGREKTRETMGMPVVAITPERFQEWGLLAACESPSNLRRALFEIQNRLRFLALKKGEVDAAVPLFDESELVVLESRTGAEGATSGASPESASMPVSSEDRRALLRPFVSHMQHLINRFCAPANAPVDARAEVDEAFTKKYHEEAKKLGVYVHPAIQVVKIPGAGRGLMCSTSVPAGTTVVDVPETAMVNVYGGLRDPAFAHVVKFLLTLRPAHPPNEADEGAPADARPAASDSAASAVPLVDTDTVTLLYFLFEVERGDASRFRFFFQEMVPPPRDERQQPLLLGPPEIPEFLGDTPLVRTIDESQLKAFNLFRRLLPVLRDTFSSYEKFLALCFPDGGEQAAAAGAGARGEPTDAEKRRQWEEISAFLGALDLQKFIWGQGLMGSRAFAVKVPPPASFPGWEVDLRRAEGGEGVTAEQSDEVSPLESNHKRAKVSALACARSDGGFSADHGDTEADPEEDGDDNDEDAVPFLPELREKHSAPTLYRARLDSSSSSSSFCSSALCGGGDGGDNAGLICIPDHPTTFLLFADLMNHHVHSQCAFPFFDSVTRSARIVVQADLPPRAQLFIFYGPMQSWELLAHYGFTTSTFYGLAPGAEPRCEAACCGGWNFTRETKGNPYDTLTLSFEPPDDDSDEETRRLLLRLFDVPRESLLRTGLPHFSSRLLDCLRISLHPEVDTLVASLHRQRRALEREAHREEAAVRAVRCHSETVEAGTKKNPCAEGQNGDCGQSPGNKRARGCAHRWAFSVLFRGDGYCCGESGELAEAAETEPKTCQGSDLGDSESEAEEETENEEDLLVTKSCCVPVAQTAHELLEARKAGLAQLQAWQLDEMQRPHWYDAWADRAEAFLENQIELFSRIYDLFATAPDDAVLTKD